MEVVELYNTIQAMTKAFCDVTFVCDGQNVYASRDVLVKSCLYFKTLLSGSMRESRLKVIELKVTPYHAFRSVVHYAMTGDLPVDDWTSDQWTSLISLAYEYQYDSLLEKAIEVFTTDQLETTVKLLNVAVRLDLVKLSIKCWTTVDARGNELVNNSKVFSQLQHDVLKQLLDRDTLFVDEKKLLVALTKWADDHPEVDLRPLMSRIRWIQVNDDGVRNFAKAQEDGGALVKANVQPRQTSGTLPGAVCIPYVNIAQLSFGFDKKLLGKGDEEDDFVDLSRYSLVINCPNMFLINTIRFRLLKSYECGYSILLEGDESRTLDRRGCYGLQELYFPATYVNKITIGTSILKLELNAFECMFSFDTPRLFGGHYAAERNLVFDPRPLIVERNQTLSLTLRQTCLVSNIALFVQRLSAMGELIVNIYNGPQIDVRRRTDFNVDHQGVVLLEFEEDYFSSIEVNFPDERVKLLHVECPAERKTLRIAKRLNSC